MIAERLRKAVLQAAIQGKLTEQLPEDGNATDLLAEIGVEKERLIQEGKIKRQKPLPEIMEDEIPFEIPENWCWVRLGEVGLIVGGGTPKTGDIRNWANGMIPWITPADMRGLTTKYVAKGARFITEHGLNTSAAQLMPAGSVLFSSRAPIGYTAIASNELCTNQGFKSVVPFFMSLNLYLYYCLIGLKDEIEKKGSGTTFKEVSGTVMGNVIVPLCPPAEQQRIVAKLEEVLPQIDKLQAEEEALAKLQDEFPQKLKNSLLQAAIQGKLTEQFPEDGDARELLAVIEAEKERLIKEGKNKKQKPLPEIAEEEIPFEIPENWAWVRVGDMAWMINGDRGKNYPGKSYWINSGVPFINAGALNNGILTDALFNYISEERYELLRSGFIELNDFLYCLRGSLGKFALNSTFTKGAIASSLVIIRMIDAGLRDYFRVYLDAPIAQQMIDRVSSGTAQPNLSAESVRQYLLPLPPLAEQQRIVTRLEELMPLCEALE